MKKRLSKNKKVKIRTMKKKPKMKAAVPKAKKKIQRVVIPKQVGNRLQKIIISSDEKMFLLKNGRKLRSMYDLVKALEKMSDEVFSYHVTPYKNDFSAWIYHVFSEVELARLLANEKNKKQTLIIIKEYFRK
jgi:hypothetical protein